MAGICQCLVSVTSPPPQCDANCIYAPDMLVSDSVTACDLTGIINISPIITNCGTSPVFYSIVSTKNVTGTPIITSSTITFVPENNSYAPGEIKYMVKCGMLSRIGTIIIIYKDNCIGITCGASQTCDKCTGICSAKPGNLVINKTATTLAGGSGLIIG